MIRFLLALLSLALFLLPRESGAQLSVANLTTGVDTTCTTASPPVTASVTPSANKLILMCVTNRIATAPVGTVVPNNSNGITWTELVTLTSTANTTRVTLYRAMAASPTTGTFGFTLSANQASCSWGMMEWTGMDTAGTNGSGAIIGSPATAGAGATNLTVTLPAFSGGTNATYVCFGSNANQTLTPDSPLVEIGTQATGGVHTLQASDAVLLTPRMTTVGSTALLGIALEIKDINVVPPTGRRRMVPPPPFIRWLPTDWFRPATAYGGLLE